MSNKIAENVSKYTQTDREQVVKLYEKLQKISKKKAKRE